MNVNGWHVDERMNKEEHGKIFGIKMRIKSANYPKALIGVASALGGRAIRMCASSAEEGMMEVSAYVEAGSAEEVKRMLGAIREVADLEIWEGEGDPVLASTRRSADLLILPVEVLFYVSESMGGMLGSAGAALSYHIAYKIGERLMDVMSSVREPKEVGEAALYVERALDRYGLGDAEIYVSDDVPIRVRAVVRPRERGFDEATASMVRGLVAGMLSRALGRQLSVGSQVVEGGVARFELVEGAGPWW